MSAPYTHTVELPFDSAKCAEQIATLVDSQFALIVTGTHFANVSDAAWKASRKTGKYYRVALHEPDTNAVIVSKIA